MKKLALLFVLVISGATYGKEIPSPFWFSISEKILTEAHQLMDLDDREITSKTMVKTKALKTVKAKNPLKCVNKKEAVLALPFFTISNGSAWIIAE